MTSSKVLILLDSDVLIHLFHAEKISILKELYQDRVKILDIVVNELRSNRTINNNLDSIFIFSGLKEIPFPTNSLLREYTELKKRINGKGERATLVYCKNFKDIIASCNTTEIVSYCNEHSIEYLTTLDIFCVAIKKGLMNNLEANNYINAIRNKGSFPCCKTIEEHFTNHFDTKKLLF